MWSRIIPRPKLVKMLKFNWNLIFGYLILVQSGSLWSHTCNLSCLRCGPCDWRLGRIAHQLRTENVDFRYTFVILVIHACFSRPTYADICYYPAIVRNYPKRLFFPFPGVLNCTKLWLPMTSALHLQYILNTYVIHMQFIRHYPLFVR